MTGPTQAELNRANAERAAEIYRASVGPVGSGAAWARACQAAAESVAQTLSATRNLADIGSALVQSARHLRVLRSLMAPPISQDQYALATSDYSKSAENADSGLALEKAAKLAADFAVRRDRAITAWVDRDDAPTQAELALATARAVAILAQQAFATNARTASADKQELDAIDLLVKRGWREVKNPKIEQASDLAEKCFARKARIQAGAAAQEVDIACRLKGAYLLAIECKVTNDETNSTKRINDIVKKANIWKAEFGARVKTAALLQGVIRAADIDRLTAADVAVFWSHDLAEFGAWIDAQV